MAVGMSSYAATKALDAMLRNVSFAIAQGYIQLHVGDPGAAGTSNPATETTRKAASFSAAGSGSASSSADVTWTNIAGSQDATHFSVWDASSAGNFLGSGTITANAYIAGDTYVLLSGQVTIAFSGLAA